MTDVAEAQRIDTELAAQYLVIEEAARRLGWAYSSIMNFYQTINRTKTTYVRKQRAVLDLDGRVLTREVALAWLTEKAASDPDGYDVTHGFRNTYSVELATVREREATLDAERAKAREMDSAYTGWSRFFVVTSSNGHIHRSMHCQTCRWSTTYGWIPELSGLTEEDAVAKCGPNLCSVCFPSAPLDHLGKLTAAQARKLAYQG